MHIFLDAGGAFLAVPIAAFAFMILAIVTEGIIISKVFKLKSIGGAMLDSLLMNVISYIFGMVLLFMLAVSDPFDVSDRPLIIWLIAFIFTLLTEGLVLRLRNRSVSLKRLSIVIIVINVASYIVLAGFIVMKAGIQYLIYE